MQSLTFPVPTHEQLTVALDNLETASMLAGLPKKLTGLNREAFYIRTQINATIAEVDLPDDPGVTDVLSDVAFASEHISAETLQLLIDA